MDCSSARRVSFGCQPHCSESTFYLQTFGQLNLAIAFRNGVLVVDIIEAKSLAASDQGICSCYVKVGMAPDSGGATRQKTEMVPDSRSPVFHETFLFAVGHEEEKKRLLFTAWNSAGSTRKLVGCMSFGVCSLIRSEKEVSGWYYLLGEELGWTKHLRVDPDWTHTSGHVGEK
ncbi:hypothetical protein AOLI_G00264040 [Acnodon oligacanthus]